MGKLLAFLGLLLFGLVAFVLWKTAIPKNVSTQSYSSDWLLYSHPDVPFTFRHPADFQTSDPQQYDIEGVNDQVIHLGEKVRLGIQDACISDYGFSFKPLTESFQSYVKKELARYQSWEPSFRLEQVPVNGHQAFKLTGRLNNARTIDGDSKAAHDIAFTYLSNQKYIVLLYSCSEGGVNNWEMEELAKSVQFTTE